MVRLLVSAALLLAACLSASAQTMLGGAHLDGTPIKRLAPPGTKAIVLFFVATECPISNRTFPEMERLRETYSARDIRFWFVYPNSGESPTEIHRHQLAYDPEGIAILDPNSRLVALTHARVTPEAAILTPAPHSAWKPSYVGRIDDRYVNIGLQRPQPTQLLVDRALTALLANQPIPQDSAQPIGCAILPAHPLP
jgi:hypothetical protein